MRDCDKYIEMISSLIDCELLPEQEAELHAHLEKCEECKKVYQVFSGISHALTDELVEPPAMLAKGVMYKIKRQEKKKIGNRFAFGRFTAVAACLALVLFGASHFGLFNGLKASSSKVESLSKSGDAVVMEDGTSDYSSTDENAKVVAEGQPLEGEGGEQSLLTASLPTSECPDDTVLQFGFTGPSVMTSEDNMGKLNKEPALLFEAKEMQVYEGSYYATETDTQKNKLLFTLETEEELKALYELVTAMPENAVEYTPEDSKILEECPQYTLFVPVDKQEDEDGKDKKICIWFVKGEVWCVISDIIGANELAVLNAEKIIYKAEGLQEKFEAYVSQIRKIDGIT